VYLYNPSNTTKRNALSCISLTQDNVVSLVALDGLYKYTDSLLHTGKESSKG
jgi:hypothetical protein